MKREKVLAVDLGASGGRCMLAEFDADRIVLQEAHRFSNDPVTVGTTMYWDVLRLFHEIKQGMRRAKHAGGFSSVSVDTWGVDFGLLGADGRLLENPVHYRDVRTLGMAEKSVSLMEKQRLYRLTGNQIMDINTAFQLFSLKEQRPALLAGASSLLLMPDLFHYFLCGVKKTDVSIASTTQLYDASGKGWSREVLQAFGIPQDLLPLICSCGTRIGSLSPMICEELGLEGAEVIAGAGHDTQCAMAAVPAIEKDFIFISCGTWSLFGTETDCPIVNETSFSCNLTNEQGAGGRTSFLKNIIGLWLIQESRRQWMREGHTFNFGELEEMAQKEKPFLCLIDPDDPVFTPAGNMPERIREYCRQTGQPVPKNEGQIVRCIDESLALKYRHCKSEIETCTKKTYRKIHLVGGGAQSGLLCRMTANACGCPVAAGPVEATALGNAAIQLMAMGRLRDMEKLRETIRNSADIVTYMPEKSAEDWNSAYARFLRLPEQRRQGKD